MMKNSRGNRFKQQPKPKNLKKSLLRLWVYFKDEKKIIITIMLFIVIDCILVILCPYLVGKIIDLTQIKNQKMFIIALSCLTFSYLMDSIVIFMKNFLVLGMSQRAVKSMRKALFEKLQTLPVSFFDKSSKGDIMSRISNDTENISGGISDSIISLISGIFTLASTFIVMVILSPILTLCTMFIIPLVVVLTKMITTKTRILFKEQQKCLGSLNGHTEEMIGGINIVKTFNYEQHSIENFKEKNKQLLKVSTKAQVYSSLLMPMMNVINNLAFGLISVVGALLVTRDIITVGLIATFLSYSKNFTRPLNELANVFNNLQSAVAGCERIFEILDNEDESKDDDKCILFDNINKALSFENVSFSYEKNEEVLKEINLIIRANTSNAIVGATGSGKTTVVNLISRFYEVDKGNVKIDGIDIRKYCKESYRNSFGVVLQDSYLFTESIKENIKYGDLNASDEKIIDVCKSIGAHDFIMKLENGYDTIINESGQELSQGQRQLLAIARCIIKDTNILILDEATSNIDTETELKIQKSITEIMKNKTTFIIAHRLSTIRNCDNIIVIENGRIKEVGSHEELMNKKGYYYKNVKLLNTSS